MMSTTNDAKELYKYNNLPNHDIIEKILESFNSNPVNWARTRHCALAYATSPKEGWLQAIRHGTSVESGNNTAWTYLCNTYPSVVTDAVLALIAWPESRDLFEMDYETVHKLHAEGDYAATLLYPVVYIFRNTKSLPL